MFTVQYAGVNGEAATLEFDAKARSRLVMFLAKFDRPILAVYEQATPITKAIRRDLAEWPGTKSQAAETFIKSPA